MPSPENTAAQRLSELAASVEQAAHRFDAKGKAVQLVAVSKTFSAEEVRPFLAAGQRVFGENRVQEAKGKWPALKAEFPDVVLHLIGPLQTNKVREAVELFDVIETVDREKLADALAVEFRRAGRALPVFVQVNIGREDQKSGIDPDEAVAFAQRCRDVHGLDVRGLMCIPPADVPPGPYFALLAMLARQAGLAGLSMGMSADYKLAVGMGATHIRVGSALFGKRDYAAG